MRFFAGGNTADGFVSHFDDLLPARERKRMIFLKGGPGVGKSSMMKRVADAYERRGFEVESFHCSSDPDSLDGIAVPSLGFGMMDGTAPHVYDPSVPAARDELLNLEDCLDHEQLRLHREDAEVLMRQISALFQRAYGFLGAAAKVRDASMRGAALPKAVFELTNELCEHHLPLRGGYGSSRTLFAEAYTPKGLVSYVSSLPQTCAVTLQTGFGQDATPLLSALAERAQGRGLNVVRLMDPLKPERMLHLAIPMHKLLFTTAAVPNAAEKIPPERWFAPSEEREEAFDRNAFELLLQRAVEQLQAAKRVHDTLEQIYTPAMDFARWEELLKPLLPKEPVSQG